MWLSTVSKREMRAVFKAQTKGAAVTVDAYCFHSANQGAAVNVVTILRLKYLLEPSKKITKERLCKEMIMKRKNNI